MAPKRARCRGTDVSDATAEELFETHIRASECTRDKMFAYGKNDVKQAPAWPDIYKHRHFLVDLAVATKGRLLRFVV